jgi:hypothetical protein
LHHFQNFLDAARVIFPVDAIVSVFVPAKMVAARRGASKEPSGDCRDTYQRGAGFNYFSYLRALRILIPSPDPVKQSTGGTNLPSFLIDRRAAMKAKLSTA